MTGTELYKTGDFAEAHKAFTRTLKSTKDAPIRAAQLCNRGACSMHMGYLSAALEDLSSSLQINLKQEKAWARMAAVLIRQKRYEDAISALEDGLKVLPGNKQLQDILLTAREFRFRARHPLYNPLSVAIDSLAPSPVTRKKVADAFDRFVALEQRYFKGLSAADRQGLCEGDDEPLSKITEEMSIAGEVLLLLLGLKPCVLIAHPWPKYASSIVGLAVRPFVAATKDIDGVVMELREITHEMRTTSFTTTGGEHKGFKGGWVLANRMDDRYGHVRRTFYEAKQGYLVLEDAVALALGYPGTLEESDRERHTFDVSYKGRRVGSRAPQKPYLEYSCHGSDLPVCKWHLSVCRRACEGITELQAYFNHSCSTD
ncbi:unnamed protein product [Vitrella brassicaformis CCMP3155]|uniref:Uncharacterized protein n=1 Tax=Vitrella brassicaformis (strain CCMP3155) TaxID=1169540 RepID=A0A0G4EEB9_VITBC|nr:unnamed protein product [Vitrella brassicaformis CCMP3155]|eukprot:CEL93726.1 unnamed protein product [Vitrella brassicaformis CCMP3155]